MKINAIVISWFLAILGIIYIYNQMMGLSQTHFFGSTEAEEIQVKPEFDGRIKQIHVNPGQTVRQGDTLLVLEVFDFDKRKADLNQQIQMAEFANRVDQNINTQEKKILEAEYRYKLSELQNELSELEQQAGIQKELKNKVSSVFDLKSNGQSSLLQTEMEGIRKQIKDLETEKSARMAAIDQFAYKKSGGHRAYLNAQKSEMNFLDQEYQNRYILSTLNGMIGEFYFHPGDFIDSRSVIFSITSSKPSKVKAFLPESSELIPQIGRKVFLQSSYRTEVSDSGAIIYVYPTISELPYRLRKIPEMRAYGRELYIALPPDNPFFVGEKVRIDLIP
ncbi:MAG: biotin/lipoyl-binding protein [Saprospiraceae bacterium]|nr:biotin/lipoyl-binding protein [Saprospiraceae bacterium]